MAIVFIIDKEPDRREKIAQSFSQNNEVREFWINDLPSRNSDCDILLIHYRDDNSYLATIGRTIAVYYGGGGESDPKWDTRSDKRKNSERICRAISPNGEGALTQQEAQGLIAYTESLETSDREPKPKFLQPPQDFYTLVAISILCQGHLIAFAHQSNNEDVQQALDYMRYTPVSQYIEKNSTRSTPSELWSVLTNEDINAARTEWEVLTKGDKGPFDSIEDLFEGIGLVIDNKIEDEEDFNITVATEYPKLAERLREIE